MRLLEFVCVEYTPLKVGGLHDALKNDPNVLKDIKLLLLKHVSLVDLGPEQRLGLAIVKNMMMLHGLNEAAAGAQTLPVSDREDNIEVINSNYKDL